MISTGRESLMTLGWQLGVIVAIALSFIVVWHLSRPNGRWSSAIRSRYIHGVPWGSLISISGVLLFYLIVQRGLWYWYDPVTVAFTASSYYNPLGVITAGIAHSSPGHLTNNLTAALVLAPLAEYVYGHYPPDDRRSRFTVVTNPYVRAFVIFPAAVLTAALFTGLFAWGPVIGFSGVVFAFAGFTLVKFPIVTILALLARSAMRTIIQSVTDPVVIAQAAPTFSRPSWAGIAVQGHALGLLLGVIAGAYIMWRRQERPDPLRLWVGSVLAGMSLSLWAFWWTRGTDVYVLYRGLGVVAVLILSLLITIALVVDDRPWWGDLTYRQTAVLLLFIPLLTMSLVAIPLNLNTVTVQGPENGIEVGDYYVFYDRDVHDEMIGVIDISLFGETTSVTTNGVIVASDDRNVWRREVSSSRLGFSGSETVVVGGLTWRDTIEATRNGWNPVGADRVYMIWFEYDGDRSLAYATSMQQVEPVIDGRQIYIGPHEGEFILEVYSSDSVSWTTVPVTNESVTLEGITIVNDDDRLFAKTDDGTSVRIAAIEHYNS